MNTRPMSHHSPKQKLVFLVANATFLIAFYILRSLILNLNAWLFSFMVLVEGCIILGLIVPLFFKRFRTREGVRVSFLHVILILSVFFYVGHLVTVPALYLYHYRAISVFTKHKNDIPEADRTNGDWILNEKDFIVSPEERAILESNYAASSPCYFQDGFCYFQLGGMLHNTGGYALRIDKNKTAPGAFGFGRVNGTTPLVGDWFYYYK
ncbi:hypothetical protein SAMN04488109_4250 [Chryseolinea serpens]|uniref:Uncharacterized protein n=2 Tax=Chryseolinea serpens TaxID=947013 RepID=A0A1M5TSZ1_9BACT|nr:hypothetical protein SAMN04488109_4250 [Chryseolinea serpens]